MRSGALEAYPTCQAHHLERYGYNAGMNNSDLRSHQSTARACWSGDPSAPPDNYGDVSAEYLAAIEGCALVDLTDRSHIELTGRDRATFLHNFCTQEIKRLPAGSGTEAFLTNIKGRIVGHVLVFVGEAAIWLDAVSGAASTILPHLDRYLITEDVQLLDRSSDWGEFALIGASAAHHADRLIPGSGVWPVFRHAQAGDVVVRRFSFGASPGWLLGAPRDRLPQLWGDLTSAGACPCGRAAFESLRIEEGFPTYGVDLTEDNLAHEAGRTAQAISFTKGCYLGQEPIARLESLGHANRSLRRLQVESDVVPPAGAAVQADDGRALGNITSSALSPLSRRAVALAMLRTEGVRAGEAVRVDSPHGLLTAVVQ